MAYCLKNLDFFDFFDFFAAFDFFDFFDIRRVLIENILRYFCYIYV